MIDRIYKKISLEKMRTRTPGLTPYIPFNVKAPENNFIKISSGETGNGNWGGFVGDVANSTTSYNDLIRNYFIVRQILNTSVKLKKIDGSEFYSSIFSTSTEVLDKYSFAPENANDYKTNSKGLYYKVSGTTPEHVVLIKDYETFIKKYETVDYKKSKEAEYYIGLLNVPTSVSGETITPISGDKVPSFFYLTEIKTWYDWMNAHKDSEDCCVRREYERRGGDAMLSFLSKHLTDLATRLAELNSKNYLVPRINVPVFLQQDYSEPGILTSYDESASYGNNIESGRATTLDIPAESKLQTLRTRRKDYNEEGELLPFVILSGNTPSIPFNTSEVFNSYLVDTSNYIGDFIKTIQYYDTNGNKVNSPVNGGKVEFEYVIGGKYYHEHTATTECEINIIGPQDITFEKATGGTISGITIQSTCDWSWYIIEEETTYLNMIYNGVKYSGNLEIYGVKGQGDSKIVSIESNCKWKASNVPSNCKVTPSSGKDFGNITISIEGTSASAETNFVIDILYGENYENKKTITLKVQPAVLSFNPASISSLSYTGKTYTTQLNATGGSWVLCCDQDWVNYTPKSGESSATITVTVDKNTKYSTDNRTAVITAKMGDLSATHTIEQEPSAFYTIILGRIITNVDGSSTFDTSDINLDISQNSEISVIIADYNGKIIEPGTAEYTKIGGWKFVSYEASGSPSGKYKIEPSASTEQDYFIFKNNIQTPGSTGEILCEGKVIVSLGNYPDITGSSPIIRLTNQILNTSDKSSAITGDTLDGKSIQADINGWSMSGSVFTNVPTGWTVDITLDPFISASQYAFGFASGYSFQNLTITSNISWITKVDYVIPRYTQTTSEVYENAPAEEKGVWDHIPEVSEGEKYIMVTGSTNSSDGYWMLDKVTGDEGWCSINPNYGTETKNVSIFVNPNSTNAIRKAVITVSGVTEEESQGDTVLYLDVYQSTQEVFPSITSLMPTYTNLTADTTNSSVTYTASTSYINDPLIWLIPDKLETKLEVQSFNRDGNTQTSTIKYVETIPHEDPHTMVVKQKDIPIVSATTKLELYPSPLKISVSQIASTLNSISISWTCTGGSEYYVFLNDELKGQTKANEWTFEGLADETTYDIMVFALATPEHLSSYDEISGKTSYYVWGDKYFEIENPQYSIALIPASGGTSSPKNPAVNYKEEYIIRNFKDVKVEDGISSSTATITSYEVNDLLSPAASFNTTNGVIKAENRNNNTGETRELCSSIVANAKYKTTTGTTRNYWGTIEQQENKYLGIEYATPSGVTLSQIKNIPATGITSSTNITEYVSKSDKNGKVEQNVTRKYTATAITTTESFDYTYSYNPSTFTQPFLASSSDTKVLEVTCTYSANEKSNSTSIELIQTGNVKKQTTLYDATTARVNFDPADNVTVSYNSGTTETNTKVIATVDYKTYSHWDGQTPTDGEVIESSTSGLVTTVVNESPILYSPQDTITNGEKLQIKAEVSNIHTTASTHARLSISCGYGTAYIDITQQGDKYEYDNLESATLTYHNAPASGGTLNPEGSMVLRFKWASDGKTERETVDPTSIKYVKNMGITGATIVGTGGTISADTLGTTLTENKTRIVSAMTDTLSYKDTVRVISASSVKSADVWQSPNERTGTFNYTINSVSGNPTYITAGTVTLTADNVYKRYHYKYTSGAEEDVNYETNLYWKSSKGNLDSSSTTQTRAGIHNNKLVVTTSETSYILSVSAITINPEVSATTNINVVKTLVVKDLKQIASKLDTVTVSWSCEDGFTYDIYNGDTKVGSTTNTTYEVSGLTSGKTYTIGVIAHGMNKGVQTYGSSAKATVSAKTSSVIWTAHTFYYTGEFSYPSIPAKGNNDVYPRNIPEEIDCRRDGIITDFAGVTAHTDDLQAATIDGFSGQTFAGATLDEKLFDKYGVVDVDSRGTTVGDARIVCKVWIKSSLGKVTGITRDYTEITQALNKIESASADTPTLELTQTRDIPATGITNANPSYYIERGTINQNVTYKYSSNAVSSGIQHPDYTYTYNPSALTVSVRESTAGTSAITVTCSYTANSMSNTSSIKMWQLGNEKKSVTYYDNDKATIEFNTPLATVACTSGDTNVATISATVPYSSYTYWEGQEPTSGTGKTGDSAVTVTRVSSGSTDVYTRQTSLANGSTLVVTATDNKHTTAEKNVAITFKWGTKTAEILIVQLGDELTISAYTANFTYGIIPASGVTSLAPTYGMKGTRVWKSDNQYYDTKNLSPVTLTYKSHAGLTGATIDTSTCKLNVNSLGTTPIDDRTRVASAITVTVKYSTVSKTAKCDVYQEENVVTASTTSYLMDNLTPASSYTTGGTIGLTANGVYKRTHNEYTSGSKENVDENTTLSWVTTNGSLSKTATTATSSGVHNNSIVVSSSDTNYAIYISATTPDTSVKKTTSINVVKTLVVKNLKQTASTLNSVSVSWSCDGGYTYDIYNGSTLIITLTNTTSYTLTGLNSGSSYTIGVVAHGQNQGTQTYGTSAKATVSAKTSSVVWTAHTFYYATELTYPQVSAAGTRSGETDPGVVPTSIPEVKCKRDGYIKNYAGTVVSTTTDTQTASFDSFSGQTVTGATLDEATFGKKGTVLVASRGTVTGNTRTVCKVCIKASLGSQTGLTPYVNVTQAANNVEVTASKPSGLTLSQSQNIVASGVTGASTSNYITRNKNTVTQTITKKYTSGSQTSSTEQVEYTYSYNPSSFTVSYLASLDDTEVVTVTCTYTANGKSNTTTIKLKQSGNIQKTYTEYNTGNTKVAFSSESLSMPCTGGTNSGITLTATVPYSAYTYWVGQTPKSGTKTTGESGTTASVSIDGSWLSGPSSLSNGGRLSVTATSNAHQTSARFTTVTASCNGKSSIVTVTQSSDTKKYSSFSGGNVAYIIIPASGGTASPTFGKSYAYYTWQSDGTAAETKEVTPTIKCNGYTSKISEATVNLTTGDVTTESRGTVSGDARTVATKMSFTLTYSSKTSTTTANVTQEENYAGSPVRNGLTIQLVSGPADIPASGGTVYSSSCSLTGVYSRYVTYNSKATASTTSESCTPTYVWTTSSVSANSLYDTVTTSKTNIGNLVVYGTAGGFTSPSINITVYQGINKVESSSTTTSSWTEDYQTSTAVTGTSYTYENPMISPISKTVSGDTTATTISAYAEYTETKVGTVTTTWYACSQPITKKTYTSTYVATIKGTITRTGQSRTQPWSGIAELKTCLVRLGSHPNWVTSTTHDLSTSALTIYYTTNTTGADRSGTIYLANALNTTKTTTFTLTQKALPVTKVYLCTIVNKNDPGIVYLSDDETTISPYPAPTNINVYIKATDGSETYGVNATIDQYTSDAQLSWHIGIIEGIEQSQVSPTIYEGGGYRYIIKSAVILLEDK